MSDLTQLFPTDFRLRAFAGNSVENGLCFMETAAFIAGEPISDHPKCACSMLSWFGIELNDASQAFRDQLLPLAWAVAGTRDDASLHRRAPILAATVMRAQREVGVQRYGIDTVATLLLDARAMPGNVGRMAGRMLRNVFTVTTPELQARIVAIALDGFRRAIKAGPHGGFPDEATCARVLEGLQRAPSVREAVSA